MQGNWHYPVEILFGAARVNELPKEAINMGFKRPLMVIDPYLLENPAILDVIKKLKEKTEAVRIFSQITPNPDEETIQLGVNVFQEMQADGLITIGGGSALDSGKTIAFMSAQHRELWDFIDEGDNYLRANDNIPKIVALPTTSGTGAEVGRACVIKNSEKENKYILFHPKMQPSLVIADPLLTCSVPPSLTAHTALDAFSHCLEAYVAPGFHPMADGIAMEGMRLIKENLEIAFHHGDNIHARSKLMAAAIMGATAFQKGLGAIHGLSHPVGAKYNLSHGLLNALFMPSVLSFNQEVIKDKQHRLEHFLNLADGHHGSLNHWLNELYKRLDLPKGLTELGAKAEDADEIAKMALKDPSTQTNPRPLSHNDYKTLYLAAL